MVYKPSKSSMYKAALAVLLGVLGTSAAAPANVARASNSSSCASLGAGALDTAGNFTLAALNTTLPNANTTGAPLVLGQAGAVDGASFAVLSTWASYPYDEFPALALVGGGLVGYAAGGGAAVSTGATNGTTLGFLITYPAPAPSTGFCIVPGSGRLPLLAYAGRTDQFSLCNYDEARAQRNVAYNASAAEDPYYYDYSTCTPVVLQVVGLQQ